VWSGWQELETYGNGVLKERVTYGAGLDEIVRLENLTSGVLYPVYDATGNLVMVLDDDGQPVERYEYSPFGRRWIFADSDPPEIDQARLKDGAFWLEISEEVDFEALQAAVGDGRLVLTDEDANETMAIAVTRPVGGGRQAGRRAVITPATTPAVGTQVKLEMSAGTLFDFFGNAGEDSLALTFDWPAGALMFLDAIAPRVEQVCTKNGVLEVQFSEEVSLSLATGLMLVDGQAQTWSFAPDRYSLVSAPLPDGVHELSISAGSALDLNGHGLASGFAVTFSVGASAPAEQIVWSPGVPGSIASSAAGNRFGFHGRPVDVESGLLYFRNRYYDPELGRFTSADPMGYIDGPSTYQFSGSNPYSFSDPLGLRLKAGKEELDKIIDILRYVGASHLAGTLAITGGGDRGEVYFSRDPADFSRNIMLWVKESRRNPVVRFLFKVIVDPMIVIDFQFVDDPLEEWGGANAGFIRGKDGIWRGNVHFNVDAVGSSDHKVMGVNDTWIDLVVEAAILHELGHPYGGRVLGLHSDVRILGQEGKTNQYAADREDEFRAAVGAPLRGSHTRGLLCKVWGSEDCERRMWCVEQRIHSEAEDCRVMWERRVFEFNPKPYEPEFIEFELPDLP
jgi:RHS repeat-associated protein